MLDERVEFVRPVVPRLEDVEPDFRSVLSSGVVTKGRFLREFELAIAAHLGVRHAVGVSSCTAGLMLVYRCLDLTGDVIVPSFTFMATVSGLAWTGARPVFVDVDPETGNLDPHAVAAMISSSTESIVASHIFGNPAAVDALKEIADKHGIRLVFDAAHGFGALYRGEPVGRQGDTQVFSLSPTKLLIAGEGGVVATNDDELARRVRLAREYGNDGSYNSEMAGMNARLPELNAVLAMTSLGLLETAARRRNELAQLYRARLACLPGIRFQAVHPQDRSSYKDFSVMVDPALSDGITRDFLADGLAKRGVETRPYYDPPVHRHAAYCHLHDGRPLPNTEVLASQSLSLPMWSRMDDDIVHHVCDQIETIWERGRMNT